MDFRSAHVFNADKADNIANFAPDRNQHPNTDSPTDTISEIMRIPKGVRQVNQQALSR
jgi:hypothetical protein